MEGNSTIPQELYADLVLLNGKIVTVDSKDSIVEAVACKGEKIVAVTFRVWTNWGLALGAGR